MITSGALDLVGSKEEVGPYDFERQKETFKIVLKCGCNNAKAESSEKKIIGKLYDVSFKALFFLGRLQMQEWPEFCGFYQ